MEKYLIDDFKKKFANKTIYPRSNISTNGLNGPVIHVNDDEICFGEQSNICFYTILRSCISNICRTYIILFFN